MPVFLGIDGGGTACRALAAEIPSGALSSGSSELGGLPENWLEGAFHGQGGAANLATTPPDHFLRSLRKSTEGCPRPDFVCGCFAGVLTDQDHRWVIETLGELFPWARVSAYPDYTAAHAARPEADLTIAAGTGSVLCSRVDGKFVKSGGRGYLLGDVGSAYRYGREAFLRFLDGPQPSSALRAAVFDLLGTEDQSEAVAAVYRSGSPAAMLSRLAGAFAMDLGAGERYAAAFLQSESTALAGLVVGHMERFGLGAPSPGSQRSPASPTGGEAGGLKASLAGGLWKVSLEFQRALERAWKAGNLGVEVTFRPLTSPPVQGALRLAIELFGTDKATGT